MDNSGLDLKWLLKVRTAVARCGEMDCGGWWNSSGQLGPQGASVLRRGFPRTHYFAQARSVISIAANRSAEVFDPPNSATLWRLDSATEEAFERDWEIWLENGVEWRPFFEAVAAVRSGDVVDALTQLELVEPQEVAAASALSVEPSGQAARLVGPFQADRHTVAMLALGHAKGAARKLVVPYAIRAAA